MLRFVISLYNSDMFFNRNSIVVGIIVGLVVPFVGLAILMMLNEQLAYLDITFPNGSTFDGLSPRLLNALAICLNLIPFRYYVSQYKNESLRGVVFPTVLYVIYWMSKFGFGLF